MTEANDALIRRTQWECSDDYPGVIERIADNWRLVLADLSGHREVELQRRDGGEWYRFIGECAEAGGFDFPDDFGLPSDRPKLTLV